jgi:hypothetical protein
MSVLTLTIMVPIIMSFTFNDDPGTCMAWSPDSRNTGGEKR